MGILAAISLLLWGNGSVDGSGSNFHHCFKTGYYLGVGLCFKSLVVLCREVPLLKVGCGSGVAFEQTRLSISPLE